jgi:hypothetical protein
MTRLRWAAVLGVVFVAAAAVAENPCAPSTLVAKQKRTDMKHREPASTGTHIEPTTVAEMISWEQPDELPDRDVRSSNSAIDPREEEVFALEGDLWRIAEEANDCDYHLEISAPGKNNKAGRVIVEVPNDPAFAEARHNVLEALTAADRTKLENSGEVVLDESVRLKLTGYAFFDAFHYSPQFSATHPGKCHFTKAEKLQRGNSHGTCMVATLWELHPVWKLSSTP